VPSYIKCISVQCPTDDAQTFAPGCRKDSPGYNLLLEEPVSSGLDDCLAFQMAQALNIYQFDFYNDWTTGSLYTFLLKYKKRLRASEKFCEYDCSDSDFKNDPNYSGVDGNNNGIPDNTCHDQVLLDTCFSCTSSNCQNEDRPTNTVREGLVKKYKDELYYASTQHNGNFKLFATDITCLGSVFNCDWQGFPKLQPLLVETSYKLPPETAQVEELDNNTESLIESGMVNLGPYDGLFFDIDCIGLHVNSTQCLNIRHACEIFVDGDESTITGNTVTDAADGVFGSKDTFGNEFRDSYIILNSGTTSLNSYSINSNMNSNFNIQNQYTYNNVSSTDNGQAYNDFRWDNNANNNRYSQPKHSFYMYFGLFPGKTALDKMNDKFFNTCVPIEKVGIVIDATSSASTQPIGSSLCDGKIIFTPIGGIEPYTYTVTSPNGYNFSGNTSLGYELKPLCEGAYTINVIDSLGYTATQIVSVGGVLPLTCFVGVSKNATTANANDGEITVFSVYGGTPPYTFKLQNSLGATVSTVSNPSSIPFTFTGLDVDVLGYTVTVEDSASSPACTTTGLTITGPTPLILTATVTGATCSNVADGKISLTYGGGQPPYNLETTGTTYTSFISTSANLTGLLPDTYISTH
jgi:hypothetical protein